jgi:hypothetical protein
VCPRYFKKYKNKPKKTSSPPQSNPRKVIRIIRELSNQRGLESEETVAQAIRELPKIVSLVEIMPKNSRDDLDGHDLKITLAGSQKEFFLQIKSSLGFAQIFLKDKKHEKIPVLVRQSGASQKEIQAAFLRIISRLENKQTKIIEIAQISS